MLVHGAYADGSSWGAVIPLLQAAGMNVTAVQNPLTALADDVAATKRALALQDGPLILAGHSYAGTVIGEAGVDPRVAGLVYVAARAPDAGEDYPALTRRFPDAARLGRPDSCRRLRATERGRVPARLRQWRRSGARPRALCRAGPHFGLAVRRPHHPGGVAQQAELLRGVAERPHHQPGP